MNNTHTINHNEMKFICSHESTGVGAFGLSVYVDEDKNHIRAKLDTPEDDFHIAELDAITGTLDYIRTADKDATIYISSYIYSLLQGFHTNDDYEYFIIKINNTIMSYNRTFEYFAQGEVRQQKLLRIKLAVRPENEKVILWSELNKEVKK